jgi:hypothetical protein
MLSVINTTNDAYSLPYSHYTDLAFLSQVGTFLFLPLKGGDYNVHKPQRIVPRFRYGRLHFLRVQTSLLSRRLSESRT